MAQSIQIHAFSIIILFVLYMSTKQQARSIRQKNRFFVALLALNGLTMSMKILMALTKGYVSGIEEVILHGSTAIYYISSVVIVFHWLLYLHNHVKGEQTTKKYLMIAIAPYLLMSFVSIILSLAGIPVMYRIQSSGNIERYFMYGPVIFTAYIIMIGSIIYVLWHKDDLTKSEFTTLMMYLLPPAIGIFLNEAIDGAELLWPSMTVSLLIVYVNIQSKMTNTDPLTGVFNRREYERQVAYISNDKVFKRGVGAIIIDIDDFKQINDIHSHQVGDSTLVDVSQILQLSVRKNDFIARIGGDEFCMIIDSDQESILHDVINRIHQHMDIYNEEKQDQFQIHLSMGYGIFDQKNHGTFRSFLERIDKRMYQDKQLTKSNKNDE